MLKLCKFSVKYPGYKYVKNMYKLYNITDTARYWSKKDYIVASWTAADEIYKAGYYYRSCYTTLQAAEAAIKKYGAGKIFHKSELVFCYCEEF